jgi:cysteine desulfurase
MLAEHTSPSYQPHIRWKNPIINRMSVHPVLYLDNNASTPLAAPVLEAMVKCARCQHANPASPHQLGRRARHVVERVREEILGDLGGNLTGAKPDRLIFTSGATEANNLVLRGMGRTGPFILSSVEHPSVTRVGEILIQEGNEVRWLSVNGNGLISLDQLECFLRQGASLVSIIWANHETGVLQPMAEIADLCRQYNIPLHTDATQIIAKKKINLREIAVNALTFSSHKFHGPKGIGCLFVRGDVSLEPLVYGGFQQAGIRPGTESPVLVEGLGAAWKWSQSQREHVVHPLAVMRDLLEKRLSVAFSRIVFHGFRAARSPQTSCFSLAGIDRQALMMALDQVGVACSTGAACESGAAQRSATLAAMGCETSLLEAAIRLSVGYLNTPDEIEDASVRIINCIHNLQQPSSLVSTAIPARREGSKMVD